jgi:hypothetical protein
MGPFSPNHTLAERGDFCTRTTRQGKNVACEGGVLIGLWFRARLSRKLSHPGEKNGHHTHDTSRSSDNAKSLDLPD